MVYLCDMKIIGITGGIGSGKSTICKVFETLGIPVFNADEVAKNIYDVDADALAQVRDEFGEQVISNGKVNRVELAKRVFNNADELTKLNAIVHPLVRKHFKIWMANQSAPYVLREAAILIESGAHTDCDKIILVSAPQETRIQRVMKRSNISEQEVRNRMAHQWTDDQRRPYCHYEIKNHQDQLILDDVYSIHQELVAL
jgi:dephospho-CoA kinase